MSDNTTPTVPESPDLPDLDKLPPGVTALGVSNLVASNNTNGILGSGISAIAGAMPNSKVSQTLGTAQSVANAYRAAQQGSALGVGMALAGAVPGSDFSEAMGKIGAVSNALSAAKSGSMLGTGMALAGVAPDSPFAEVMGQVAQAKDMFTQGMAILNPSINPSDLMMNLNGARSLDKPVTTQSSQVSLSGKGGSYIKGEGLKCEACALANNEAQVGDPVNALYGSKVLAGGDDIDYSGTGYMPFTLGRIYNSQNPDTGWFGQGWVTRGYEQRLELDPQHNRIYLVDNTGRRVPFTYLAPGQQCYQPYENLTLYRLPLAADKKHTRLDSRPTAADATNATRIGDSEPLEFILYQGNYHLSETRPDYFDSIAQHYRYVASRNKRGTKAVILLSSYTDKYGHKIQLHYTRSKHQSNAHIPQYLTDEGGGCYEFEFISINDQQRLAKLYKIKDLQKRQAVAEYSYSLEGDLIKVSRHGQITREFAYNNHLLTEQTMASGQKVAYHYDRYDNPKAARVIEQATSSGRHYLFEYDRDLNGLGTTIVTEQPNSELERQRVYTYDDWYNMTSLTDYSGNTTRYRYDDLNRISRVTLANNSHTNAYYEGSHLSRIEMQIGTNEITQLPSYREVSYQYNKAGQRTAITDALGNQQQYRYNHQGELIAKTDPLGNITHYQYDEHGNTIQQTLANGSSFSFDYDEHGNLLTQSDCSEYQTHYQYDDKQRLRQITDAEGNVTRYQYNERLPQLEQLISQVHYPDGSHTKMDYDDLGRLTTHTDALGHQTKYHYGSDGLPSYRTETNVKQKDDKTFKLNKANDNSIGYAYDVFGRLTTLTNENNEKWLFEYDKSDNLISETRFDGHQSCYQYDELDQVTAQIDNPNLPRSSQYHIHLQRNISGQLIAKHSSHYPEQIGQQSNKPRRAQYHRVRYDYDELGQLISAVNSNSRTNLAYDASGKLIQETLISHLTQAGQYQAREHTLQHKYDEIGNRIATTLPDGKVINQLYYGSGHLYNQSLYDPGVDKHLEIYHSEHNKLHQEISRQQGVLESNYIYDPMGRLTKQHSAKHSANHKHLTVERHYNYDVLGQLTHLSGRSVLQSDDRNQPNASHQQHTFTRNHQYQYDNIGRLTEHKLTDYQYQSGITEVFAFDPASNRVPVKAADNTNKAQTDTLKNEHGRPRELIQNGQRIRYTYDSHGRVLYKTTEPVGQDNKPLKQSTNSLLAHRHALQLQYNANNELEKSLRTQYEGNKVTKTLTNYQYDAFGRRIHKHSETRNFIQSKEQLRQTTKTQHQHTHMLWDSDLPIQEYNDTHVYTTIYDQGSFEPVARLAWLRDDIPQPINDESENDEEWYGNNKPEPSPAIQIYHYHNDQLGTPNELTNDKGEVVWLADYEAWGKTAKVIYTPVKINQIQVSQGDLQPIRFQGQYFDEETGLHYNRFRYYDPDMGMFTTRDPIGLMGGLNIFAYAPNPTGWVDPLGLEVSIANAAKTAGRFARGVPGVVWQAITPTTMGDATLPIDSEALERVRAKAKEKDSSCTSGKCCPPCDPKVGSIGYRLDLPPSRSHYNKASVVKSVAKLGIKASVGDHPTPHYNLYIMTQKPPALKCECKWKNLNVAVNPPLNPLWHEIK